MTVQELLVMVSGDSACDECFDGVGHIRREDIGRICRLERKRQKVKLKDISKALRKSRQYVSDLESGKRNWNNDIVSAYLKALGPQRNYD